MLLPLLLLHAFCGSQVWGLGTGIASHMLCRHVGRLQSCFVDEKGGQAQSTKLEADPMPTCLWGPGCCCHLARCTPREQASVLAWPAQSVPAQGCFPHCGLGQGLVIFW